MRLMCPQCHAGIVVADSEAGKEVACTACAAKFVAPELMHTTIGINPADLYPVAPLPAPETPPASRPATEPVPAAPPANQPDESIAKPQAAQPQLVAGQRFHSFGLEPRMLRWVPAVCLSLALLLTFFKWVGLFPGGYSAYSQNAWQALFAGFSSDPICETVLQLEKKIDSQLRTSWWLFPYLVLLFAGVILTWFGYFADRLGGVDRLPGFLKRFWHLRTRLLVGIAIATFAFLLLQSWSGFGLAKGLNRGVEEDFKARLDAADVSVEQEKVRVEMAVAMHNYHVDTTFWLRLAIYTHLLAVVAIGLEHWLTRRGDKPPPRIGVMW